MPLSPETITFIFIEEAAGIITAIESSVKAVDEATIYEPVTIGIIEIIVVVALYEALTIGSFSVIWAAKALPKSSIVFATTVVTV